MASNSQGRQQPAVFISYAHESDALRASVRELANWLGRNGCSVLTDHAYENRPPAEGWQAWMHGCIEKSATVLVVCTPKLKARYEKTAAPDSGRGATYEGAIVTQHIYDAAMRNTKFYPILPDDGDEGDIPTFLKSWWNGHLFPSGNQGILRMIFDDPSGAGSTHGAMAGADPSRSALWASGEEQERLASRLLGAPAALPFFHALQGEYASEFNSTNSQTADEMVQRFSQCQADQVQQLFFVVRRALDTVPVSRDDSGSRRAAEEAAAALYFVAACRLVDQATRTASVANGYVLHVPKTERIVCAVVATALFGGEIRLVPCDEPELPTSEYVFEVKVPACGDHVAADFERAAYAVVMANDRDAPEVAKGTGRLEPHRSERLAARLRTIRRVRRASLSLVVHGLSQAEDCRGFGMAHQVPVMLPATEATEALLGMDGGTLLAEIKEFWSELQFLGRPASQPHEEPVRHSAQGATTMSSPGPNVIVTGGNANISISSGDHTVSQAGTGNTAESRHKQGTELAALVPLVQELTQAIGELASPKAREALKAQAEEAAAEVSKPDKPDAGRIKRALDAIKSGAEGLDGGGKIIALCNKAYQVLAPFLGLPPSPLP